MEFSYPIVSKNGVKALRDDLLAVVTQESGEIVFPDYFEISIDNLDGLEYLIMQWECFGFLTCSETDNTELKELLCEISFIVFFMIPFVCVVGSCSKQEQKRIFSIMNQRDGNVEKV